MATGNNVPITRVRSFLQLRDTRVNLHMQNPVLFDGEYGLEIDTGYIKIGDGKTPWRDLKYFMHRPELVTRTKDGFLGPDDFEFLQSVKDLEDRIAALEDEMFDDIIGINFVMMFKDLSTAEIKSGIWDKDRYLLVC